MSGVVPDDGDGHERVDPDALRVALHRLVEARAGRPVTDDEDLSEAGLDSLSVMDAVMVVELDFGITIPDQALARATSIDAIVELVVGDLDQAGGDAVASEPLPVAARRRNIGPRRLARRMRTRREGLALVDRVQAEIGVTTPRRELHRISVVRNAGGWRAEVRRVASVVEGSAPFAESGVDARDRALASPAGVVVLTAHTPGAILALRPFAATGRPIAVIGSARRELDALGLAAQREAAHAGVEPGPADALAYGVQLAHARRVLAEGGVALLAGDGLLGDSFTERAFLGRRRPFGLGGSELSRRSGAVAVTALTHLDGRGTIHLTWSPPVDDPDHVVDAFARHLSRLWREQLGSVNWHALAKFLELPFLEAAP